MSVEDVWARWWRLLINEDHEAQAVELFLSFDESEQAELLGWLAGRSRRTREKVRAIAQEMIQLQAEAIEEYKMQQATIDDLTRQIRELKGLPPLDRATA
jgi:hypothetical protein